MKNLTSFQFYHNSKYDTLDILLHGGSKEGMNMSLMQKVFRLSISQGHSVLTFNFPFAERGMEQSSGPELVEELETLQTFLNYCDYKNFSKVRLIGKSLGGIIASFYLDQLNSEDPQKLSVIILGYVVGSLDKLKNFKGPITIIQGERDKFGGIKEVKKDLSTAISRNITYFEIKGADHSYRESDTKRPIYEDEAIQLLLKIN